MLDRQPILEPSYSKPRVVEVDLVTAAANRLADAQSVTKHRENEEMIADSMAPVFDGVEKCDDFRFPQEILAPLMRVRGGHGNFFCCGCAAIRGSRAWPAFRMNWPSSNSFARSIRHPLCSTACFPINSSAGGGASQPRGPKKSTVIQRRPGSRGSPPSCICADER